MSGKTKPQRPVRQKPGAEPKIAFLIRLSPEAREIIEKAAAKDGRAISNFIAHYAEEKARHIAS